MSIEANKQRLAELESQKAQLFSMAERFPSDESLLNKMESLLLDIATEEIAIQIHSIPEHPATKTNATKVATSNDPIDRPKVAKIPADVVNELDAPAIDPIPTPKTTTPKKAAPAKTKKTK